MAAKNNFFKTSALFLVLALTVTAYTGCSRNSKTVHTETYPGGTVTTTSTAPATSTVVTEKTVEHHHDDPSVIGSAFNFIGEVIAFPFKLVGWVFSSIF